MHIFRVSYAKRVKSIYRNNRYLYARVITVFEMVQRRRHVPGTAVLVTVGRAQRGRLFFVRVKLRRTAVVVVAGQPRLETRLVTAVARMLGPKIEFLLVEIAVVVPDHDHVVGLEEHVQTFVELHVPLVLAGLGRLGAATRRRAFQRRLFRFWLAAVV